jgi:hypothetical protein
MESGKPDKRGSGVNWGIVKRGQENSEIIKPNDLLLLTGHANEVKGSSALEPA